MGALSLNFKGLTQQGYTFVKTNPPRIHGDAALMMHIGFTLFWSGASGEAPDHWTELASLAEHAFGWNRLGYVKAFGHPDTRGTVSGFSETPHLPNAGAR